MGRFWGLPKGRGSRDVGTRAAPPFQTWGEKSGLGHSAGLKPTGYYTLPGEDRKEPFKGEYQDFLTGFVTADGEVWGRPVGVAVAPDGSLLVTDDGGNCIWRVSYVGH